MSNTSNSKIDENYVWSNKQHIITNKLCIYHDKMLFIKDTYHRDISKIYFIEIMDQDITLNDIGFVKSFTIDKLNHQGKCINAKLTYGIKSDKRWRKTKKCQRDTQCTHLFNINTISNIINGDYKHDICNNNTKIGILAINQINELWYIFCDKIYIEDNQVMETTIDRWKEKIK